MYDTRERHETSSARTCYSHKFSDGRSFLWMFYCFFFLIAAFRITPCAAPLPRILPKKTTFRDNNVSAWRIFGALSNFPSSGISIFRGFAHPARSVNKKYTFSRLGRITVFTWNLQTRYGPLRSLTNSKSIPSAASGTYQSQTHWREIGREGELHCAACARDPKSYSHSSSPPQWPNYECVALLPVLQARINFNALSQP